MVPVTAESMQTCQGSVPDEGVARKALKGHRHANAEVGADHDAVPERPGVWATLELIGCFRKTPKKPHKSQISQWYLIW